MEIKERRLALGWSRADLASAAKVDPRVVQLIELGHSHDQESKDRCYAALKEAEKAKNPGNS
jgi:transcriptional regulator with XRE-family HTH domain